MSDNRSLREWLVNDPRYQQDPYSYVDGVPSNPAWRYCPHLARTPSPKPKNWPPMPVAFGGPGGVLYYGAPVYRSPRVGPPIAPNPQVQPKAMNMSPSPIGVPPARPKGFCYQTPPRRTKPLPMSPTFSMPSAPSDDLLSCPSDGTLGTSGQKRSAGVRRTEGMPVMINDDSPSGFTTPQSKRDSPSGSQTSDATTLILTPNGPKKVKKHGERIQQAEGSQTLSNAETHAPSSSSSLKRSPPSSFEAVRVNVNVSIIEEGVAKRRRCE